MPLPIATIFRLFVLLALTAHVFYMYCLARTSGEMFGFDIGRFLLAAGFALVMLLPMCWAVAIAELPEMYTRHWRARHRWTHNRCPQCGYLRTDETRITTCPECGSALVEPEPYKLDRRAIRRYVSVVLMAYVLGVATAEVWISVDEAEFRSDVYSKDFLAPWLALESTGVRSTEWFIRDRRWPLSGLMCSPWHKRALIRCPVAA
jgi:hypothetical protein